MATIRKRRNKYQVQVRRKGGAPISRTFDLLADAKEWARHHERLADRGEIGPDRKELDRLTLGDVIQRYREEVLPTKRHRQTDTFSLALILMHKICRAKLSELCPTDFVRYRDERLKTVTLATVKRQFSPVRHMLGHARDEWGIPIRADLLSKLKFAGADKRRDRRLKECELGNLLAAGQLSQNRYLIPIVQLALETGMRRSEIIALRYRSVNWERSIATIQESKNGHSRSIPLSSKAISTLKTSIATMSEKAKAGNAQIFPLTPNAVRLAWNRLTKRAKIRDLHFHDLRHEAISRFFEHGLTVPEVASISGHRDIRMLMRYAHARMGVVQQKLDGVW